MERLRIVVTGLVGLHPVGGVAWDYLQYVVGLARLGHDVYYHEDTWSWPYHPVEKRHTSEADYSARYIESFFARYAPELQDRWHYKHLHETSFGMPRTRFDNAARTADVFLNISGSSLIPENLSPNCIKVFVDTDPGYNQIVLSERPDWSENVERWSATVAEHDRHFSYAENMYGEDCTIPKLGYHWYPTRMPVVLDLWRRLASSRRSPDAPWSTVMTWNAFKGRLTYKDVEYKSKGGEFEKFIDLPRMVSTPLKVAVGGVRAPSAMLTARGWIVDDGPSVTLTPDQYQGFIQNSRGEFSTAKHVYVATRSGWFSCRTACYLAGGRPAVVQDTGFSSVLPKGEGLFAFETLQDAAAAIEEVESNYPRHARSALEFAKEHFDSDRVLKKLLDDSFSTQPLGKNADVGS